MKQIVAMATDCGNNMVTWLLVVKFPYTPGAVADKGGSGRSGNEARAI